MGDGKVSRPSANCVEKHLTGAHIGFGGSFFGAWQPNPASGALCPYKGLAN